METKLWKEDLSSSSWFLSISPWFWKLYTIFDISKESPSPLAIHNSMTHALINLLCYGKQIDCSHGYSYGGNLSWTIWVTCTPLKDAFDLFLMSILAMYTFHNLKKEDQYRWNRQDGMSDKRTLLVPHTMKMYQFVYKTQELMNTNDSNILGHSSLVKHKKCPSYDCTNNEAKHKCAIT